VKPADDGLQRVPKGGRDPAAREPEEEQRERREDAKADDRRFADDIGRHHRVGEEKQVVEQHGQQPARHQPAIARGLGLEFEERLEPRRKTHQRPAKPSCFAHLVAERDQFGILINTCTTVLRIARPWMTVGNRKKPARRDRRHMRPIGHIEQ
jgi:hypothetical protein